MPFTYHIKEVSTDFIIYVGSTACFKRRISQHKWAVNNGMQDLYKYIRANGGLDNFNFEIIKQTDTFRESQIIERNLVKELEPICNMIRNTFRTPDECRLYGNEWLKQHPRSKPDSLFCRCGGKYQPRAFSIHEKTNRHIEYVKS